MSQELRQRISRELGNLPKRKAVAGATDNAFFGRLRQWAKLAGQGRLQNLRDRARAAKEQVMNDHSRYLGQFTRAVQERGGQVHFAATAAEAVAHVLAIARQHNARLVVKSKSMVSEEIHLNPALEAAGIEVVETDLGEYIVQLRGEAPAHIVGPAIHLTRHDVADLFADRLGEPITTTDPEALTAVARRVLREKFLAADVGITGANFGIAETGTVVLVTNEGNGRMVTSVPRVMITLIGLEKLVPSWADLDAFIELLPRSASGHDITAYVSAITGPRRPGEIGGPEELHVVVLDAGRKRLLNSPYQDALRCIRCGACLNACPVFRQVGGGHGYGSVYSGPIGVVITPLLQGLEQAGELLDACSLCGACAEACPMQIPLPHLIREQRAERVQARLVPFWERMLFRLWAWTWSAPGRYRCSLWLLRLLARPWSRNGYLTWLPGPLAAWGGGRDFPAPAASSLRERWADLEREVE